MGVHEALKPLCWLVGKWRSIEATGSYSNIKPFKYREKMEFLSNGQPMLNYKSITCDPETLCPLHLASGFLAIKPDCTEVAFLVAHNLGMTSVESGCAEDDKMFLKSTNIALMEFVKDPKVLKITRNFSYDKHRDELYVLLSMKTFDTPLTKYLHAKYEREQY